MDHNEDRKRKIIRFLYSKLTSILILSVIIGFGLYIGISHAVEILRLQQEKRDIAEQIEQKKIENVQLDEDLAQAGSQEAIERRARDLLQLYYPYEQIVIPETPKEMRTNNRDDSTEVEETETQETEEVQVLEPTETEVQDEQTEEQESG